MSPQDFKSRETGRLVKAGGGYWAFVPAPLPPQLRYDDQTVLLLSRADAALSELSGLGRHLPNPLLLIGPYVRREAVLSSRIEGTKTNLADLLLEELQPGAAHGDPDDLCEVRNYIAALDHGARALERLPLSLRLVKEIHSRLMKGVRGGHATPGEFRRSQNWIGPPGSTLKDATYVPPPPHELMKALGHWEKFLHRRDAVPELVQCALIHEQFETIHPFLDGNGRVGRLLITLFLIERDRLSQPLLYLSAYFEARRAEYYRRLQAVRTEGDWTGWIQFFLLGVAETAREAIQRAGKLMELRESYRKRLANHPKSLLLLDQLFINPYVTVAKAATLIRSSIPTARQTVERLTKLGMLHETTGKKWGRVYLAKPIFSIIERASPRSE